MNPTTLAKASTILFGAALFIQPAAAQVDSFKWIGSTGNWSNPQNWNGDSSGGLGVPPPLSAVFVENGGTAQITDSQAIREFNIARPGNSTGTVEILTGGTLAVSGEVIVGGGLNSDGHLTIRGGSLVMLNPSHLGEVWVGPRTSEPTSGTVTISDGGSLTMLSSVALVKGTLQIGEGGAAGTLSAEAISARDSLGKLVFNHNESSYTFDTRIGSSGGGDGGVVLHNGSGVTTLTQTNFYLGGTQLNAGVLAVSQNANLGGAAGTLTFNSGTLRTTGGFTMNRSTQVNAGGGAIEVASGTLTHQGAISGEGALAKIGAGTLAITGTSSQAGGISVNAGKLSVGDGTTAGTVTVGSGTHAAITLDGGELEVRNGSVAGGTGANGTTLGGNGGVAVAQIAAGTVTNQDTIRGGNGGTASVSTGGATGGIGGTAMTMSAATLLTNNGLISGGAGGNASVGIGLATGGAGGTGVQWSSTGTLVNNDTIVGGNGGAGTLSGAGGAALVISGGGVLENSAGASIRGGFGLTGFGSGVQYTTTAGSLINKGLIIGGVSMGNFANKVTLHTGSVINDGGLLMGNSTASHLALDGDGSQNLSAATGSALGFSGSLTKVGSGTWTVDRFLNTAGDINVDAGTLILIDAGPGASVLGTGEVIVGVNGNLAGMGTILGDTQVAGTLAPGNSPGTMTYGGALFLENTAVVQMELAGPTSFDKIVVGGLLTYDGTLSITLLGGYTPEIGDTFELFDAGNVAALSSFDAIVFNGTDYHGSVNYSTGVLTITAVPEPSTAALCLVAGAVFLKGKRKVKRCNL